MFVIGLCSAGERRGSGSFDGVDLGEFCTSGGGILRGGRRNGVGEIELRGVDVVRSLGGLCGFGEDGGLGICGEREGEGQTVDEDRSSPARTGHANGFSEV